jgi:hypothetical protein
MRKTAKKMCEKYADSRDSTGESCGLNKNKAALQVRSAGIINFLFIFFRILLEADEGE